MNPTEFADRRPSTGWGEPSADYDRKGSRERLSIDMRDPHQADIVPFGFVGGDDVQGKKSTAKRTRVRKLDVTDTVRPGLIEPKLKGKAAKQAMQQQQQQPRVVERPRRRGTQSNSSGSDGGHPSDDDHYNRESRAHRRRPSQGHERDADRYDSYEARDRGASRSRSNDRQYNTFSDDYSDDDRDVRRSNAGGARRSEHDRGDREHEHGRRSGDRRREHERDGRDSDDYNDRRAGRDDRQRGRQSAVRSRIPSEQHMHEAPVHEAARSRPLERTSGKAAPQSPEQSTAVGMEESSRLTPPTVGNAAADGVDIKAAVAEGFKEAMKEAAAALLVQSQAARDAAAHNRREVVAHPITPEPLAEHHAPTRSHAAPAHSRAAEEEAARLTPPLHKGTALPREQPSASDPLHFDPADAEELREFVSGAAPELAGTVRCEIRRDKKGVGKGKHPVYYLHLERPNVKDPSKTDKVFLLAGRKRKKCKTTNYLISCDPADLSRDSDSYLAKLRANFVGTHFTIFDNGENMEKDLNKEKHKGKDHRKELGSIIYEKNLLGAKGPRKMHVVIPAMDHKQKAMEFKPLRESDTMQERIKLKRMDDLIAMENKQPEWSEASQSYELKFGGRVTMASVKNFQIVHPKQPDYKVLQFGRVGEHSFTMDYQYPMSALQAFSICLSSLDGKLACE